MSSTPALVTPDFGKTFIVEYDLSGLEVGAVLTQEERPLTFENKQFKEKYLVKSAYEKEMEAIFHAIKKW
jgi:hypothetical protein